MLFLHQWCGNIKKGCGNNTTQSKTQGVFGLFTTQISKWVWKYHYPYFLLFNLSSKESNHVLFIFFIVSPTTPTIHYGYIFSSFLLFHLHYGYTPKPTWTTFWLFDCFSFCLGKWYFHTCNWYFHTNIEMCILKRTNCLCT